MTNEPRFPFVLVDTTPDDADVLSYELFELGAQGVEERDDSTLVKGAGGGKVTLVASFGSEEEAKQAIANLPAENNPRLEEVIGDAWRDAWKEHFRPFTLAKGLVIRPPWEPYEAKAGEHVLELEPGRAFGTGLHETTSLVCQALASRENELKNALVLDIGCGSGILSLAALVYGAERCVCVDIDPDSVDVTNENAARNQMSARIAASTTDVSQMTDVGDVVLANIEARVLIPMMNDLVKRVRPGGLLILSGILVPQKNDVLAAYGALQLLEAPEKGEWIALVLKKAA